VSSTPITPNNTGIVGIDPGKAAPVRSGPIRSLARSLPVVGGWSVPIQYRLLVRGKPVRPVLFVGGRLDSTRLGVDLSSASASGGSIVVVVVVLLALVVVTGPTG